MSFERFPVCPICRSYGYWNAHDLVWVCLLHGRIIDPENSAGKAIGNPEAKK